MGGMVKNTFIHIDTSEHSLYLETSRKRSYSVPKHVGSHIFESQPSQRSCSFHQSPLVTLDALESGGCTFTWNIDVLSTASTSPPRDQSDVEAQSDLWSDISGSHAEQP